MPPDTSPVTSNEPINLRRLVWLRLIAFGGQCAAVAFAVYGLDLVLPVVPLVSILGLVAVAVVLTGWRAHGATSVTEAELFGQLVFDVTALTALLYLTGGSTNPFAFLYLLPLTFTAVALPGAWTWAMAALTAACYTLLLFLYVPLPKGHAGYGHDFRLHVFGMWLGFMISAGLISWFAVRMAATVRARDQTIATMRERQLREEQVLALGTLAAGAAHELGTPLSTMAVLVQDLRGDIPAGASQVRTLREQIARCKTILGSLSAAAGAVRAESATAVSLDKYLQELLANWEQSRPGVTLRRKFNGPVPGPHIVVDQVLSQALLNILNNAADASPGNIEISGRWSDESLMLEVADRGPGLEAEAASRAWEAGFSTKIGGLGLGLFLTHATLQRLGGEVHLQNREGGGVLCRITLPLSPLRVPGGAGK